MWLSDTPPRNGQVSGSEMLTNLKGSPYEKFSMWVCQRDKMRKYGQPGGMLKLAVKLKLPSPLTCPCSLELSHVASAVAFLKMPLLTICTASV